MSDKEYTYKRTRTAGMGDSVVEDLNKAISTIKYLPNGVASWMEAHGGNVALAQRNKETLREVHDLLVDILMSMPKAVHYIVINQGNRLEFKDIDDLIH